MTGWRAYALGAFTGIVAWHALSAAGAWLVDRRRGQRKPTTDYFEGALMGIAMGAGVALVVGVGLAAVD